MTKPSERKLRNERVSPKQIFPLRGLRPIGSRYFHLCDNSGKDQSKTSGKWRRQRAAAPGHAESSARRNRAPGGLWPLGGRAVPGPHAPHYLLLLWFGFRFQPAFPHASAL